MAVVSRLAVRLGLVLLVAVSIVCALTGNTAFGQSGIRSVPSDSYFIYFNSLQRGDYATALQGFEDEIGSAVKTVESRWVDSICYYTMAGECYYRMGNLAKALDNYNAALTVYVAYPTWMLQAQFPDSVSADNPKPTPWGRTRRTTRVGRFNSVRVQMGRLDNEGVIRKGGVVRAPYFISVNVTEIVRCTALAIRRRRELLGPVAAHDRLTDEVLRAAGKRSAPPNHWSRAWADLQVGLALAAAGKSGQAIGQISGALQVAGEFDHPITGSLLVELGRLSLEAGDLNTAATMFDEATYSAAQFFDYSTMEEAFRYGQIVHLMSNGKGVYPPLDKAAAWARSDAPELHASLLVLLAENFAVGGDNIRAASLVGEARTKIIRTSMAQTDIGSRLSYVDAMLHYRKGNSGEGDKLMAAALQFYGVASKWLFQINLADTLVLSQRDISDRNKSQMYAALLRDPTAADWGINPLECLAVLLTPHHGAYERWFEAALRGTGEAEAAVEVADRARRHRFHSALPLGGRLLSLRWILEAPAEELDRLSLLQRQDLLARYPNYSKLADEATRTREALLRTPLVAASQDEFKAQSAQIAKLAKISQAQEAILREIAVRREPAEAAFPPVRKTKEVQAALADGQLMLVFFATSRNMYAFLFSNQQYAAWEVSSVAELERRLANMYKAMGMVDANRELTVSQLTDDSWRTSASEATQVLLHNSKVNLGEGCKELIVVPDGLLWHFPFELLQISGGQPTESLINRSRVRYVPTMSLAHSKRHGRKDTPTTAVALGKMYPRDEDGVTAAAFEQLKGSVAGSIALQGPLPGPSPVYKSLFDGLVVLDDLAGTESPFGWAPIPLDKSRAAGALANWQSLPWGSPDHVILPGFHTAAENGLKRGATSGHDMFLSVCGLMATGTRTILISRWRTGGQTGYDLVREFAQELPHTTASEAWQRSLQLVRESPLNPAAEPRVKAASQGEVLRADHPFFWAGYLLVDSGSLPQKLAEDAEPPKLNFEKQAAGNGALKGDAEMKPVVEEMAAEKGDPKPVLPEIEPESPQEKPEVPSAPTKGRGKRTPARAKSKAAKASF